jgi:murein DD-endopeptidase MepM/ murein hydrolase activator NlpD
MTTQPKDLRGAAQQLESVLLRQMLAESKAFKVGESSGSHVYADMFVTVVADAVAKAGGLGLAGALERSLSGPSPAPPHAPAPHDASPPLSPSGVSLEEALLAGRGHVSSGFGARTDPITGAHTTHHGIDVAAPRGSPIHALTPGTVRAAGDHGGYGLMVEVVGEDGSVTRYAHAERLHVRPGDVVQAGDVLADVGSTGRSTGPHVHVERWVDGVAVDPRSAAGHTSLAVGLQNDGRRVDNRDEEDP